MKLVANENLEKSIARELGVQDSGVSMEYLLCQQQNNSKLFKKSSIESQPNTNSDTMIQTT